MNWLSNLEFSETNLRGKLTNQEIIIRKLKNGKWRAYWLEVHKTYTDRPAWGHEWGQHIHYHAEVIRDLDGKIIQGNTKNELIEKLKRQPFITVK